MNLKTYILGVLVVVLSLFSACKKSALSSGRLVKTYTAPNNILCYGCPLTVTFSFGYDNLGRVIDDDQKMVYQYLPGMVLAPMDTFFLNSQGLRSRGTAVSNLYTYDNNGYLISDSVPATSSSPSTNNIYTISNGNISEEINFSGGLVTNTTTYTFYSDSDTRRWGDAFMGERNVNLIKTATYTNPPSVVNYTYTFDAEGRVVQEVHTPPGANIQGTYSYTY